jgi:DNA (cytosine-5)-methyltransferase 1
MKKNVKKVVFKLGELFCGPGGIAIGASKAIVNTKNTTFSIEHSWANDYHEDTCATYKHNFPKVDVICDDVKKLKIKDLKPIDCFAYGFPCNDFSIVGETKGFDGEFGGLYKYGVKVLNQFNPKFFVAENVGGLTSANEGRAFQQIVRDLRNAGKNGYNLTVHKYKFEEYGVPQTRHRIIIVGIDKSLNLEYKVPAPTTSKKYLSVKQAIEKPPINKTAYNNEQMKQSSNVIERLKYIKPGENIWQTELPKHLRLNVKGAKMSQIYRRLHPNKPSYTITGSGGGGTHGYHYSEYRALTNRERARIQTFPDDYFFVGKPESVRRQLGMAVPPLGVQIIFESILKTFAGVEYDFITPNIMDSYDLFNTETQ